MHARLLLLIALCLPLLSCMRRAPEAGEYADIEVTVYVADVIRTNDPQRPVVQAMAVKDGDVVAVGSREEVMASESVELSGSVDVVELKGVVVPGLVDSHAHLASLGRALTVQSLRGAKSAQDVVTSMKAAPRQSFQGDWLIGRGWDQNRWPDAAMPTRALLDEAFPSTPVWLTRVDGHAAWVNKAALERAGLTKQTPDPQGGKLLRDDKGELTGVLIDNAMDLVSPHMPAPTLEQRQARLKAALEKAASVGLTGVHDAGMDLSTFKVLMAWDAINRLPIRVYAMADGQGAEAEEYLGRGPFQGVKLSMQAVKLLADGALGSRGAALKQPYSDDPSTTGLLLLSEEDLRTRVEAFMERGFQVAVHAIGDAANTRTLDVFEAATKKTGGGPGRHRLEHAQLLSLNDLPRLARLGVIASMQPTHATSDMGWAEARVGADRIRGAYAWKSILESGAVLAFGSDFPVEDPAPLAGIYAARTRQDANGTPRGGWNPEQRLTGEEALAAFTTGAAFAAFVEDRRGKLLPGFDADFVSFSVDPVTAEPAELLKAKVLLTVVAGVAVYESNASSVIAAPQLNGSSGR